MLPRIWRMRDRGLFLDFLVSYLVVLILPIAVIGSVIYGRIIKQLEGEVRATNQMMLRQASRVMDLRMQELGLLAGQVSQNGLVRDFLFRPGEGPAEILKTLSLIKEIGIFQAPNRFINELVIYSFKADSLVSQQARYTPEFFYDQVDHPVGTSYTQWYAQLHQQHYGTTFAEDYLMVDGQRERYLTYLRSLPTNGGAPAGTLAAYIDGRQIRQLFAPLVDGRQGVAFIIDQDGQVLISTSEVPKIAWEFPVGGSFFVRKVGGKNMVINYERSDVTSWQYVSMVPAHLFNAEVSAVRGFMLIILLLCLLVGVVMGAFMSWRNYRPIRAILEVLNPLRARSLGRKQDELSIIMESAQEAVRENRNLRSYLEQNEALVRSNLLRRLLYGRIVPGERVEALRTLSGSPDAACAVMVVDVEVVADQPGEPTRGLMVLAATEAIQRLFPYAVAEMEDERLAVLLALDRGKDGLPATMQVAREIQESLDRDYQIPVSIGFGLAESAEEIPSAYREALQAVDYKIVKGRCTITAFSEIPQADNSYHYPLDWERQLINHIKAGDYETVSHMVDEVYAENFTRRRLPITLIRYVFYDLYGTALKVLHELNITERDVLGAELGAEHWLAQTDTAAEMREKLKQLYRHICQWIAGRRESHNTQLKEEILSTLAQDYANPNLGLGLLAGQTQVSSSYLCRFFKDQTGYNFADYLNRLRVERAKRLLEGEGLTVGEVATAVGYLSANTFIRIFKKYEGITPGQFRVGVDGRKGMAG